MYKEGYTTGQMAILIQIRVMEERAGILIACSAEINDNKQRNDPGNDPAGEDLGI